MGEYSLLLLLLCCHEVSSLIPFLISKGKKTALIRASEFGHTATAELLLVHGADPNIQSKVSNLSIFFYVAMKYHFLSFSWCQQNEDTALIHAIEKGHTATAEVLLVYRADPNIQSKVSILLLFSFCVVMKYRL